ncbi:hypothetical protein M0813_28266 [Anaeramoeba flamelloides]|uniref:Uncharacterized protein n=1 Tax=Anaeramoeba flamelloides TaxID=1746091 RepID=A0ABQ8XTR0_9EUKA|nr:hypothetical protein M0813_28266 [Anaeramoeba flamelloides]
MKNDNQYKKNKTKTKSIIGRIKTEFRTKLQGRSRKEKSAVTALFVLSTNNKQKNEEHNKKKQLLETLENGLNSSTKNQQQEQEQQLQEIQLNKSRELDLNEIRLLYRDFQMPFDKLQNQLHTPPKQELNCIFLRNKLEEPETKYINDRTSISSQFFEESYDDSLSDDLPSSSNEEFSYHTEKSRELEMGI